MKLLLLPGMDGTGTLFKPLQDALPSTLATTVVAYPRDELRSYHELLERIPLPSEPFVVVAESFSGPLAVRLAARDTPHLRGLVLAATFVRSPSRLARWVASPLFFRAAPPDFALRGALLGDDAGDKDVELLRTAISSVSPEVLAHRLREISAVDVRDELRRCRVPALAITALRDRLVPRGTANEFSRLLPSMERAAIDAPHLVLQRRPQEAAQIIVKFVERVRPLA